MSKYPRTKKSLGQHFLTDGNIIRKIVDAIPAKEDDLVIEIGPGSGAVTEVLLEKFKHVKAIELDQRMVEVLSEEYPDLEVIHQDILEYDWSVHENEERDIHVMGNLPYYITSQIMFGLFEYRSILSSATLMMQKEVAERIVAEPRSKQYGILSVQSQLMSSPEILFDVSPHVFSPPPNVHSSVIQFTFDKDELACTDAHLKKVVRMAFNQRRKKLSNALKRLDTELPVDEFNFNLRAEALNPSMYEKLTARLEQLGTFH
jgi:16S rRNA (adenine1518-N6/adenine1519-N6)-dimethyltransferase